MYFVNFYQEKISICQGESRICVKVTKRTRYVSREKGLDMHQEDRNRTYIKGKGAGYVSRENRLEICQGKRDLTCVK